METFLAKLRKLSGMEDRKSDAEKPRTFNTLEGLTDYVRGLEEDAFFNLAGCTKEQFFAANQTDPAVRKGAAERIGESVHNNLPIITGKGAQLSYIQKKQQGWQVIHALIGTEH